MEEKGLRPFGRDAPGPRGRGVRAYREIRRGDIRFFKRPLCPEQRQISGDTAPRFRESAGPALRREPAPESGVLCRFDKAGLWFRRYETGPRQRTFVQ